MPECVVEDLPHGVLAGRHRDASWSLALPSELERECLD